MSEHIPFTIEQMVDKLNQLTVFFAAFTTVQTCLTEDGYIKLTDDEGYSLSDEQISSVPDLNQATVLSLARTVVNMTDDVLIGKGGHNYDSVELLRKHGYKVVTLESDAFGPLSAAIVAEKYRIAYG